MTEEKEVDVEKTNSPDEDVTKKKETKKEQHIPLYEPWYRQQLKDAFTHFFCMAVGLKILLYKDMKFIFALEEVGLPIWFITGIYALLTSIFLATAWMVVSETGGVLFRKILTGSVMETNHRVEAKDNKMYVYLPYFDRPEIIFLKEVSELTMVEKPLNGYVTVIFHSSIFSHNPFKYKLTIESKNTMEFLDILQKALQPSSETLVEVEENPPTTVSNS